MTETRTIPAHSTCNHKNYLLSCAEYEQMLAHSGQRCEVCGLVASDHPSGKLYIDHDHRLGKWAVRGLLCSRCNTLLGKDLDVPRDASFAAYLANPWYTRMLAGRGLSPELPPEPPIGSIVDLGKRQPQRMRTRKGWERVIFGYPWHPTTWRSLYRSFGPHRLMIVSLGDGSPVKQRRRTHA